MTTLRFIFTHPVAGHARMVQVLVNGQALVVTTLARALEYTR
jgi:hypothetical protein